MKDKLIQWTIVITLLSLFVILVVKVQLGIALLLTTLATGITSIAFLMNKYLITFSKQLILVTLFCFCCILGYYKGFQPFLYSIVVCGILGFVVWWFVKDPNRQPSIISLSATKGMIDRVITKPQPYFASKGTQIEVGGYILKDPLIYVVDSKTYEDADASLLCLRREIAPPLKEHGKTLPYWPRLSDATPAQAGTYLINFSMSFTHATNNALVHISAFNSTDNTELTNIETERKIGTGGDFGNVGGTGIVVLDANDKVSLRAKADNTGNLTVNHGNFNIIRIK